MKSINLEKMFREFSILTLDQVSGTSECSIRTVQRQFAALSVLRSYNKNSRYYTLPDIPKFNTHGIWCYRDVFFSKHGDLRKTVKQLIHSSMNGLSANEIGNILNLLPQSFMHHFREMEGVFREKHAGVYIYFSSDSALFCEQVVKRIQENDLQKVSDSVAIKILIGYIKSPELSVVELSDILRYQENCHISPIIIENFLSYHNILKKTPDS